MREHLFVRIRVPYTEKLMKSRLQFTEMGEEDIHVGMQEEDFHTSDGTLIIKKPTDKRETGTWKACRYILVTEGCERVSYYGMSTNLVNYLIERLGQSNTIASNNETNWSGTCYITPVLGAFLVDSYLGRYWIDIAYWLPKSSLLV